MTQEQADALMERMENCEGESQGLGKAAGAGFGQGSMQGKGNGQGLRNAMDLDKEMARQDNIAQ